MARFNSLQKAVISKGEKLKLDTKIFAKPIFNELQMQVLLDCLVDKVDTTDIAKPKFSADKMLELRYCLEDNINISTERQISDLRDERLTAIFKSLSYSDDESAQLLKMLSTKYGLIVSDIQSYYKKMEKNVVESKSTFVSMVPPSTGKSILDGAKEIVGKFVDHITNGEVEEVVNTENSEEPKGFEVDMTPEQEQEVIAGFKAIGEAIDKIGEGISKLSDIDFQEELDESEVDEEFARLHEYLKKCMYRVPLSMVKDKIKSYTDREAVLLLKGKDVVFKLLVYDDKKYLVNDSYFVYECDI